MPRASGLERLATLYGLIERVQAAELQIARNTFEEVQRVLSKEELVERDLIRDGRTALIDGDRTEWTLALTGRSLVEARIQRIMEAQVRCEEICENATQAHRASRLQLEQVQRVIERARTASAMLQVRRSQALADDRYGSRREWIRTTTLREA